MSALSVSSPRPALSPRRLYLAALVVALLQTAVLGVMVAGRVAILRSGTEVMLKTAPVDPRDLLRGDYVVLSYDISQVPVEKILGETPAVGEAEPLHVLLRKGPDGFATLVSAAFAPIAPGGPDEVILVSDPVTWYDGQTSLSVSYGIEAYYVPEGEGQALEAARGTEALSVAVRVSREGEAQIRALYLDGRQAYEEPLY